ncbi:hypothetical protein NA57DRAFT_76638 [Rhizodiscina lignyota]|uniref:Uncharacterized protein n=1 Tax=Rhizodiscina lignyota TaxID=1504668 RepID=A0A9P4IGM0_9PEZI|nr:hypothetical protein NA57DRAFT_76638 [Rhizodiscina lignyota]
MDPSDSPESVPILSAPSPTYSPLLEHASEEANAANEQVDVAMSDEESLELHASRIHQGEIRVALDLLDDQLPPHTPSHYEEVQFHPFSPVTVAIVRQRPGPPLHKWLALKRLLSDGLCVSHLYRAERIASHLSSYPHAYLRLGLKYLRERREEALDLHRIRLSDSGNDPFTDAGNHLRTMTEEEKWDLKNKHDNAMRAWKWLERSDRGIQEILDAWVHLPQGHDRTLKRKIECLMEDIVEIRNPVVRK